MPTPKKGARLGGSPAHQKLIVANLATALFEHGRITTTEAKARVLRPVAERLITKAKAGDLHARRQVLRTIRDKGVVHTLFEEIGPRFAERPGGYTRITKIGPRKGDNAPMAVIELVTEEYVAKAKTVRTETPAAAAPAAPADSSPPRPRPRRPRSRPPPAPRSRPSRPRPRTLPATPPSRSRPRPTRTPSPDATPQLRKGPSPTPVAGPCACRGPGRSRWPRSWRDVHTCAVVTRFRARTVPQRHTCAAVTAALASAPRAGRCVTVSGWRRTRPARPGAAPRRRSGRGAVRR